jgi:alpha-glucosidase
MARSCPAWIPTFFIATAALSNGCRGKAHAPPSTASLGPPAERRDVDARVLRTIRILRTDQVVLQVVLQGVVLETTSGIYEVSAPRDDTFRIRLRRDRAARGLPSFAVTEEPAAGAPTLELEESDTSVILRTARARLRIDKNPLRLRLMTGSGELVADEALRVTWQEQGVRLDFGLKAGERVFGLGDKVRGFDRRGHTFELWNTDAYGWKVDADPLYKSLPFWLQLEAGRAHGVFVDHPARATVDVGQRRPAVVTYETRYAEALDVYLLAAAEPKNVLRAYTSLTGRTPLPALWTLGYHQSRWGYASEAEVRGVVARLQQDHIPVDAVWLDIDYQVDNAPFTVDAHAFPSFAKMVADLAASGVKTVVITDLHIKSYQHQPPPSRGYPPYDSGCAGDHFIRGRDGYFEGTVWPGPSVFPEFTRARTRSWWGRLYRGLVEQGVAGFWNDMNEPAVFVKDKTFPDSVLHRLDDGSQAIHPLVHNAYGMLNARATYEGVKGLRPEARPFVLTRAAFAGAQKYAASWTGDNTADRAHLAVTIPQLSNLGVSGYAFVGADVGGFVGCPDPELFAEWMELGAFQPFFRNHSAKDACRREPWLFGAAIEARVRGAVQRRYRLLPYLYTLFEEASRTGVPVMRPLWLEYPNAPATLGVDDAFLVGRDLLIAPSLVAGARRYRVTLPPGTWYDTTTLARLPGGVHEVEALAANPVRVFARAGAIIPESAVVQSTSWGLQGPLTLTVWPGPDSAGALYVDAGDGFAFQRGAWRRLQLSCAGRAAGLTVRSTSTGDFPPWWKEVRLVIHDVPRAPTAVVDATGPRPPYAYDPARRTLTVTLRRSATDFKVSISW